MRFECNGVERAFRSRHGDCNCEGMKKTLVVCYSRTGNTRAVATEIAKAMDGDLDLVISRENREGMIGWLRCAFDATFERETQIAHPARKVYDYDLVVVGTPTWNAALSSPIRSYLVRHASHIRAVALFATCNGRGADRAIEQMSVLCGREPLASLVVRSADIASGAANIAVAAFAQGLGRWSPASAKPRAPRSYTDATSAPLATPSASTTRT
jgi:menaquinone-dependent protoporphyrinogen IX oxidase